MQLTFLEGHPKFQACSGPRSALDVGSPTDLLEPGNDRLDNSKGVSPNLVWVEAAPVVFDHEPQPIIGGLEEDIDLAGTGVFLHVSESFPHRSQQRLSLPRFELGSFSQVDELGAYARPGLKPLNDRGQLVIQRPGGLVCLPKRGPQANRLRPGRLGDLPQPRGRGLVFTLGGGDDRLEGLQDRIVHRSQHPRSLLLSTQLLASSLNERRTSACKGTNEPARGPGRTYPEHSHRHDDQAGLAKPGVVRS